MTSTIEILVDGEHVQIVGHMAALVESKTTPGEYHATEWSEDENRWACSCKGWMVRKKCRHMAAIKRLADGEARVEVYERSDGA